MMECSVFPFGVAVTRMGHPDPITTIAKSFVRFAGTATSTSARMNACTHIGLQ